MNPKKMYFSASVEHLKEKYFSDLSLTALVKQKFFSALIISFAFNPVSNCLFHDFIWKPILLFLFSFWKSASDAISRNNEIQTTTVNWMWCFRLKYVRHWDSLLSRYIYLWWVASWFPTHWLASGHWADDKKSAGLHLSVWLHLLIINLM